MTTAQVLFHTVKCFTWLLIEVPSWNSSWEAANRAMAATVTYGKEGKLNLEVRFCIHEVSGDTGIVHFLPLPFPLSGSCASDFRFIVDLDVPRSCSSRNCTLKLGKRGKIAKWEVTFTNRSDFLQDICNVSMKYNVQSGKSYETSGIYAWPFYSFIYSKMWTSRNLGNSLWRTLLVLLLGLNVA